MSNIQKAQKIGRVLSGLAIRSILEEDHIKSRRHLRNFINILENAIKHSDNKWSVFDYEEYERQEAIYFTLIDTILNTPVDLGDTPHNPTFFNCVAIGQKNNNIFQTKNVFYNWLLEDKKRQPTLGLIIEGLSIDIHEKNDEKVLKQKIERFFSEVTGFGTLSDSKLIELSNCPELNHRKKSFMFGFGFNIRHAWIIRQLISDNFSHVRFTFPNHIKVP